jgi:pimeloyl-ACP methyl ester carboxylesterase
MAGSALSVIRPLVRAGSLIAPKLTGRVAFSLFCRTRMPGGVDAKQKEMIARAEARMAAARLEEVAYRDGKVMTYRFDPPAAAEPKTVMLLHGWTGRAAFMSAFVQPLLDAGFRVLAMDLPGHGRSSGNALHIPRAVAAVSAVHDHTGPWHGVIGHSFGGAIATACVAGAVKGFEAISPARLVLVAAPESMPAIFRNFGSSVGLNQRSQAALEAFVPRLSGHPLESFRGEAQLRGFAGDVLVIHAPDDKEVDFANTAAFAAAGPHVAVMEAPGTGHRRILYAPRVVAAAVGHMASAVAAP